MVYTICSLFSGGKDSTYALHWGVLKGFHIKCLVTLKPRRIDSWMFHYPGIDVTRLQAKALGIPQVFMETTGEKDKELRDLERAFNIAINEYGIEGVLTGALLSDYQRMNINIIAEKLGLRVYSPLWRKKQEEYMRELVASGFKFIITSIDTLGLPPKFLGKVLTRKDIEDIVQLAKTYGFNPAFEGGEAETLVLDAPLFRKVLVVNGRKIRVGEYSWRFIIENVELCDK